MKTRVKKIFLNRLVLILIGVGIAFISSAYGHSFINILGVYLVGVGVTLNTTSEERGYGEGEALYCIFYALHDLIRNKEYTRADELIDAALLTEDPATLIKNNRFLSYLLIS